jgi:hypothetical protein
MAFMATATMTRPVSQPAASGKQAAVPARPFRTGVQVTDEQPYESTVTTNASTQALNPQWDVPSTGFLNRIDVLVEGTTSGNSANVTYAANGPFNVIDTIQFTDSNGQPIIGPIDGWDLYVISKYGGYCFSDDPKQSPIYSAITGTGGTGGSFAFALHIPVELVPREGLGSLPNKSSSTPFKVKITIAATATFYGTPPTAAPAVRIRMVPKSYWQPQATDAQGNPVAQNPPAVDTTQYWTKTPYTISAGSFATQLQSSVGFPVRNMILVLKDSNGSRSQGESDWPDPLRVQVEANIMVNKLKPLWKHDIAQDYGYTGSTFDAAGAKDNGLYALPFCKDWTGKPGWESRRGYLPTTEAMRLQLQGTIGGSGTHVLDVYTNTVAPGAGSGGLAAITA